MDFILVVILVVSLAVFVHSITSSLEAQSHKSNNGNQFMVERKKCPPHQWFWQDIVDQNGEKHGERIVCKVCGPIRNIGDDNGSETN